LIARFRLLALGISALGASHALAIEEAAYDLVLADGNVEIRDYQPSLVAETVVDDNFEDAGSSAFRKLFRYIDGDNVSREEIAMTAPVSQARSEKIAMTSPVAQQAAAGGWAVSFMMPSSYTKETIPQPTDDSVVIKQIPAYRAAVIRYSGFWSEKKYLEHLDKLNEWIDSNGYKRLEEPVWARYDAPFKPWFMRRNEILIPVRKSTTGPVEE
jgi:hypothetical protein